MKFDIIFRFRHAVVLPLAFALVGLLSACSYTNGYDPTPCTLPSTVSYQTDVWPILKQNCRDACHNATYTGSHGNFDMDEFSQVYLYATTGLGGTSYIVGNIRHDAGFVPMPYSGGKLTDCQIATIKAWVEAGALKN